MPLNQILIGAVVLFGPLAVPHILVDAAPATRPLPSRTDTLVGRVGQAMPTRPGVANDAAEVAGPDGQVQASCEPGYAEIYVMDADGSDPTNLSATPGRDFLPAWSPDGARIAFTSERDCNAEIYVMNADGSDQTRITETPSYDVGAAWSPDGKRIAYASSTDSLEPKPEGFEIYVMDADGAHQTNLTPNVQGDDLAPAWSPDGARIAFVSSRDGDNALYVMDADGTNLTRLTARPANNFSPSWSPDGKRIAFVADGEIHVIDADGTHDTQLTSSDARAINLAWSPIGDRIAFTSDRDGNREIYIMDTDGANQTNLTNNPAEDRSLTWSPNGERIAFSTDRSDPIPIATPVPGMRNPTISATPVA